MIPLIDQNRKKLEQLCRAHGVASLELFGSAATDEFNGEQSDLDFLVEFQPDPPGGRFHAYFALKRDLESLFGCAVDLLEPGAMKNPYFVRRVNESRTRVYAA